MTNNFGQKKAPQHGGLTRVAFNGGENVRGELSFNAVAVNVDNWSPYWYKLNPVEEYIPPFQHGVNIRLSLIHSYEFVCQAPPGLDNTLIVATTGIPGNDKPLIAVFSSFDTNNDAGFSAIDSAANVSASIVTGGTFSGLAVRSIDVTLFNGLFVYLNAATPLVVTINYRDTPTGQVRLVYARVLSGGETYVITVPKMARFIEVTVGTDLNNPIVPITGTLLTRAFLGALSFDVVKLITQNGLPGVGDVRTVIGSGFVKFTTTGIENAVIAVQPTSAGGVLLGTWFGVTVRLLTFGGLTSTVYNKAFIYADGNVPFLFPISGIIQRDIAEIRVDLQTNLATTVTIVSMHHSMDTIDVANFDAPTPYRPFGLTVLPAGVWTLAIALQPGGRVKSANLSVRTLGGAGTVVLGAIGTGVTQDVLLGEVHVDAYQSALLNDYRPIQLYPGFASFWLFNSAAVPVSIVWYLGID